MAETSSLISGVAQRYAGSLFDLALEAKSLAEVEKNLDAFEALVNGSADLKRLIQSPVFSSDDQVKAISAILNKAKIGGLVGNFLRVVAQNRRLFSVPSMIQSFRQIAANHRGEVTADVTIRACPDGSAGNRIEGHAEKRCRQGRDNQCHR